MHTSKRSYNTRDRLNWGDTFENGVLQRYWQNLPIRIVPVNWHSSPRYALPVYVGRASQPAALRL